MKIKSLFLILILLCTLSLAGNPSPKVTMVDPHIDDQGPFCYLAYPNNEMAMDVRSEWIPVNL